MVDPFSALKGDQKPARLLVLDDDLETLDGLKTLLSREQFDVTTVKNATELDRVIGRGRFDLLILDRMLPDEDGTSIAARLKRKLTMPIIMLSALGDAQAKVDGLDRGADDYIGKPFNPQELIARIRAMLRRFSSSALDSHDRRVNFGEFVFNPERRQLTRNGRPIQLTSSEMNLLQLFVDAPYQVVDRDYIQLQLRGLRREEHDRGVDIGVLRLRNKIEPNPRTPIYIKTIWGKGYMFCPNSISD